MAPYPTITLNDKHVIPQLGFGVWQVPSDVTATVVGTAIKAGYRLIDTAAAYDNEQGVSAAIQASGVPREQLFITTKLWNAEHGYDKTLRAFDVSLSKLGLDYLDLFLIHWPMPRNRLYVETWKAFIELQKQGRVRSIGVSNFTIPCLQHILDATGVTPAVNQIELHPRFQQNEMRGFHQRHGIATESWSPLGQGQLMKDGTIESLAKKHGKTPAQIILRWQLDSGLIAIPKSVTPARISENFAVFDFRLDDDDKRAIALLDRPDGRIGPDPDTADF